jgi:tRNA threonylcarbamoyladenosine biosynthesis protein TsaE
LKVYPAKIGKKKIELVHVDAYRVENIDDIKSVGIEEYFDRDDVIMVIEWAEKIKEILPKNTKYIHFKHVNQGSREIV